MQFKVLIIDDEQSIRDVFSVLLGEKGYAVQTAIDGGEGIETACRSAPDVALLDMNLPDRPGLDVLSRIKEGCPETEIIIITAFGTIKNAVEATKLGAYAYLEKPVNNDELLLTLGRLFEVKALAREVECLRSELTSRYHFSNIVGLSGKMNSVFQLMGKMIQVDGTVLITGESGTGKELVARAIHYNGRRKEGPFVVVNCGAIPRDLIESEFFGHVKGAFTDARSEKTGKFELADQGTIFLDEIGELSQEAQVKVLRALGEREIIKVGGTKTIPVDVRVIAATNKNLEEQVQKGLFREDLYYRLAVLSLNVPPLRERKEDIPLLAEHFIRKNNQELHKHVRGLSEECIECLRRYSWPGNVRELENTIYEVMVICDQLLIEKKDLPSRILSACAESSAEEVRLSEAESLRGAVQGLARNAERKMIEGALRKTGGNRTKAARLLGISRKTLFNKMLSLQIRWPD